MTITRSDLHRLDRVGAVRQTLSSVAEARVKEAEGRVLEIQIEDDRIARNIHDTRAEVGERPGLTGQSIQQNERFIDSLVRRRKTILQSLDAAKGTLDTRRKEWIEARREQKVIERLQERRLQEWQRDEDIAAQKSVDDAFIGRLVRTRLQE